MELSKQLIRDIAFYNNVDEMYTYLVMYLLNKGSNTEIETFLRISLNPWNPAYVPKLEKFNNDDIITWLNNYYNNSVKILDVYEVKDLDPIAGKVTVCYFYEDKDGVSITDEITIKYVIEKGKIKLV